MPYLPRKIVLMRNLCIEEVVLKDTRIIGLIMEPIPAFPKVSGIDLSG